METVAGFGGNSRSQVRSCKEALYLSISLPRPPNVPPCRALWSLLGGIWGPLKGSWGVLV